MIFFKFTFWQEYNTENESKEGDSDEITEIVQSQKEFESASGSEKNVDQVI